MTRKTVFFDFGGTLGSLAPSIDEPWRAWAQVANRFGHGIAESRIRAVNEEADRRFEGQIYAYHGRTAEFWRMRDMWVIDRLGIASNRDDFFNALQTIFGDPSLVQLFPETREVLEHLRAQGYRLGIISNFTDGLIPILEYHRLGPFFESVTYSQAVGTQKPDPLVFTYALSQADCNASEAVHVGDSWEGDYLGARRAGLEAIWLNRERRTPPAPCREITDLRGLLPVLRAIA
jgi:putative hydrolase of the HAD superfamily